MHVEVNAQFEFDVDTDKTLPLAALGEFVTEQDTRGAVTTAGDHEFSLTYVEDTAADQDDHDSIQWVLLTTESVAAFSDSLSVGESYRARWIIEDWHKVLKTGCRVEERQLETWECEGRWLSRPEF